MGNFFKSTISVSSVLFLLFGSHESVTGQDVQLIGSYENSSRIYDTYVSGDYAYLASRYYRTRILNISDPENPSLCGEFSTSDIGGGVRADQNYLYTTFMTTGLYILDITNPGNPTLTGQYDPPSFSLKLAISGNYVYMANYADFRIVDVSDRSSPVLLGIYDPNDLVLDVDISGNYAYVAAPNLGLLILGISDPGYPSLIGNYNTPGRAQAVCIVNHYAYVADSDSGLQIVDIDNPTSPQRTGNFPTPVGVFDVSVVGNYAYLAASSSGLIVCDITNPNQPTFVGGYAVSDTSFSVYVSGDYIYLSDDRFLSILRFVPSAIDITNYKWPNYYLSQNYPNPFNQKTIIEYAISNRGPVSLKIINLLGQTLVEFSPGIQNPGTYNFIWNSDNLTSGLYFYQLHTDKCTINRKMMLIK